MNEIRPKLDEEATPLQIETLKRFCSTGQPVLITALENTTRGKIVQYVTLLPSDPHFGNTCLFFVPDNSPHLKTYEWGLFRAIQADGIANTEINTIKELVAKALESPQPPGATATLIKEVSKKKLAHHDLFRTLDSACKTLLQSRMIVEFLEMGDVNKAGVLYEKISAEKTEPDYLYAYFDFCYAILSLVKAGIITVKPRMKWTLAQGIIFAIREAHPRNLKDLLQKGYINADDIKRMLILREDPKVQELFRRARL